MCSYSCLLPNIARGQWPYLRFRRRLRTRLRLRLRRHHPVAAVGIVERRLIVVVADRHHSLPDGHNAAAATVAAFHIDVTRRWRRRSIVQLVAKRSDQRRPTLRPTRPQRLAHRRRRRVHPARTADVQTRRQIVEEVDEKDEINHDDKQDPSVCGFRVIGRQKNAENLISDSNVRLNAIAISDSPLM